MTVELFDFDEVVRFGDPWHGLVRNGVIELPNSTTRTPIVVPDGGDCFKVEIPGQAAVTTDAADTAAGMTWLNYALIAGDNHCLYEKQLGNDRWIYVYGSGDCWLAQLSLNIGTGAGSVSFRRFGVMPETGAVVQTATFSLTGPFSGDEFKIDDINDTGSGVLVVVSTPVDEWAYPTSAVKTFGCRNIGGGFEITISGVPPSATVTATQIASSTEAAGSSVDTLSRTHVVTNNVDTIVSVTGDFGHSNKLFGLCYGDSGPLQVLRSFSATVNSSSSVTDMYPENYIDHTGTGHADHEYTLTIGTNSLTLTGSSDWTKSGRVGFEAGVKVNHGGDLSFTRELQGTNGFTWTQTLTDNYSVWDDAGEDWIFEDDGSTDNYALPTETPVGLVAIWPQRLANRLYGLARYSYNPNTYTFEGNWLNGAVSPSGTTSIDISSSSASGRFFGTRHPVSETVVIEASTVNDNVVYR